jgi:hypothetical protein
VSVLAVQLLLLAVIAGGIWAYRRSNQGAARPCPACARPVSPGAVSCPQCGHRFGPNAGRMLLLGILLLLAVLAVFAIIAEMNLNHRIDQLGR